MIKKPKILVTGDKGYIGSILTKRLDELDFKVTGMDICYYAENLIAPEFANYQSLRKDIRNISLSDLDGIDSIIHLAALSNDPLGEFSPGLTEEINRDASINLAKLAKKAGVKRFIYSSSQSMYGIADQSGELNEDGPKHPITAYARTKWEAEQQLMTLANDNFIVVAFRPSTVFGFSPRLRTDVVFNSLLGCGYTTKRIEIKSDGTPWRPVIHIEDVCSAYIAGLTAPPELVQKQAFNVGIKGVNYQVRDMADCAGQLVPNCEVIYTGEHGSDSRTYKVNFDKINTLLSEYYNPQWDLFSGGQAMIECFDKYGFNEEQFSSRTTNRLLQLKHLTKNHHLNNQMEWQ
jgi:nucleoside-diphosphate-sugar epimerase